MRGQDVGCCNPAAEMSGLRCAVGLPNVGEYGDPRLLVELACRAESSGWDGVFIWDHVAYRELGWSVADPYISLAAIAARTSCVRVGVMIAALAQRAAGKRSPPGRRGHPAGARPGARRPPRHDGAERAADSAPADPSDSGGPSRSRRDGLARPRRRPFRAAGERQPLRASPQPGPGADRPCRAIPTAPDP